MAQRTFAIPSSKQKGPDLLKRSRLRTTATRQCKRCEHIGRYSTRKAKCVNDLEQTILKEYPFGYSSRNSPHNRQRSNNHYRFYLAEQGIVDFYPFTLTCDKTYSIIFCGMFTPVVVMLLRNSMV